MTPPTYTYNDARTIVRELCDAEESLAGILDHVTACGLSAIADELEQALASVRRACNRATEARAAFRGWT